MFLRFLSYNSIIVFVKMLASLVVSKVSAVFLGPSGYALVGNFRNIFQIIICATANGFESGTIKHVSENKTNQKKLNSTIATLLAFSIGLSVLIGFFIIVFSKLLSSIVFQSLDYIYVFRVLGFLLPFVSLNFLVLYIVNGLQKIKTYSKLVILFSLVNACVTFLLIYNFKLKGALLAIVVIHVVTLLTSLSISSVRGILYNALINIKKLCFNILKTMSVYILMAMYSTFLISVVYILIRNKIIEGFNEDFAGYWEAMNKISSFYMVFFTSVFTLYLLPNLSKNNTVKGYKDFMSYYFKWLIPLLVIMFFVLFLIRFFIIRVFLTEEFIVIEKYFVYQFIGDFIKIVAFSLAYQFHAKRMVVAYFITDAIIYMSFYFVSIYLLDIYTVEGVFYAHIISSSLYLLAVSMFIVITNKKFLKPNAT